MICHITVYPLTPHPDDVILTQQEDMMRNCFSADVQVKGIYPYYIKSYFEKNNIHFEITEQDLKDIAEGCVDFIPLVTICPTASVQMPTAPKSPAT